MEYWVSTIQRIVGANNLDLYVSMDRLQNALSVDVSVGEFRLDMQVLHVADFIGEVLNDNYWV